MNPAQDGVASNPQVSWPQPQIDGSVPGTDMRDFYNVNTGANWRNSQGYLLQYEVNYILTGVNVSAY